MKTLGGTVLSVSKTGYHVEFECAAMEFCLINNSFRAPEPPITNDNVTVEQREDKFFITDILPRKNVVSRFDEAKNRHQHFAANIDRVLIVTSANREYSESRIKRFKSLSGGIPFTVVLTKIDIAKKIPTADIKINALDPNSVKKLLALWQPNETAMLVGSSGVGKSTIINSLANLNLKTRPVQGDRHHNQGRHTTSARTVYRLACGRKIIDNPGIRVVATFTSKADLDMRPFPSNH